MPIIERLNVYGKYRFLVNIDGKGLSGVREVEGLNVTIDAEKHKEGPSVAAAKLEPGLTSCGPLVLRYFVTANDDLWNWVKEALEGNIQKKDVAVVVLDRKGDEVVRYMLGNAWPSSWTLDKLDSQSSGLLIEELVLQYEKFDRYR
jgi:phage tail-like protein